MDIVVIVTPAAKPDYAREAMRNASLRGEAPLATALMFDNVLLADHPAEREAGILCGCFAAERADRVAVYIDEGLTEEMCRVVSAAEISGTPTVYRTRLIPAADMTVLHVHRYKQAWAVINGGKT